MAWDLAIDPATGDFMFGPSRDLLGCTGPELINQRILIRSRIPRGTFTYDENGDLGSRLHRITGFTREKQVAQAPAIILEALEPMNDISINEVNAGVTENNQLDIQVRWKPVVRSDEVSVSQPDITPEFDARVTV